jgi:hypothetical protein
LITTLEVSVDIDAPAELTWNVVTDWERQGEWMPMTAVQVSADSPVGVGAKLSARSGVGPAGFVDPMVVDVWQPPHRCEVVHLGKVVTGRGVFIVDELPGGRSRFTWREELDSSGVRVIVDRVGLPPTKALLTVALKRLSHLIASEAA